MTEDNRKAAIALELHHAKLALDAAQLLRASRLYNDALSRIYYALFHTMVALLLTEGVEPKRHRALPHLLGQHFAKLLGAADIALVSRAATYRALADYERTWEATGAICDAAFAEIEPFLDRIRDHLVATGWSQR